MLPLEELRHIEFDVENATDVAELRPLYDRLGEIARIHNADFDLQLAVAEVRQRVIDKGIALKNSVVPNGSGRELRSAPPFREYRPIEDPVPLAVPNSPPPEAPASKFLDLRKTLITGAALGVTAWLIIFVILVQIARNRNIPAKPAQDAAAANAAPATTKVAPGTVPVDIVTIPSGAAISTLR